VVGVEVTALVRTNVDKTRDGMVETTVPLADDGEERLGVVGGVMVLRAERPWAQEKRFRVAVSRVMKTLIMWPAVAAGN